MTDQERAKADMLLGKIETSIGSLPDRSGANATVITDILHAVNGLRSLLNLVRSH